ncbi:unnamed protein product [Meloidogyne enterolobii]|uniref:Uncharacterized protein n=1 Tax=Meloidogyne enterolobii TaxID=390850 RepID=A0ACB0Y7A7_MELEN
MNNFQFILLLTCFGLSLCNHTDSFCSSPDFDFDCGVGELRSRCISSVWTCDYIFDCSTGADEGFLCKYLHKCPPGYFMCRNGDCILASKRCDSINNCIDRSDELACFVSTTEEEEDKEDILDQRAEAFNDQNDGTTSTFLLLALFLLVVLVVLLIVWVTRRYPDTKSQLDLALKNFNQRVRGTSSEAHVNILVPAEDNYFDNPLSTLQPPLSLNITEVTIGQ